MNGAGSGISERTCNDGEVCSTNREDRAGRRKCKHCKPSSQGPSLTCLTAWDRPGQGAEAEGDNPVSSVLLGRAYGLLGPLAERAGGAGPTH